MWSDSKVCSVVSEEQGCRGRQAKRAGERREGAPRFYRQSWAHVVLGVTLPCAYALSWHLALVADSAPRNPRHADCFTLL